ncbi:MAG: hypothetical protein LUD02_09595 [Tannerellaceae bacterium]|nr:hypothetical protein [Tannerellaceae bacterium]
MRKYVLFLFLFITLTGNAQKLHRQYSFYPQETGNLYFVHPQKAFTSTDRQAVKQLTYDITYLAPGDSATFSFTFHTKNICKSDSVFIYNAGGELVYQTAATYLYLQPHKSYWRQRVFIKLPYTLLTGLYKEENSFTICLEGNCNLRYSMKKKTWQKQSAMMNNIVDLIRYNQ